ncbi:MAG: TonB-dependent receptor, partial [Candidatus Eisenbacteria bacterium]|nr:TonB-dependent receptor [Candidatus Eisenbacteria bacterium]
MFLQNRLHRILLLALLALVVGTAAWAGTVGKISGVVTNKQSGQPLPNANVSLLGTLIGTTADAEGRYSVLNVPAGTYRVQASLVGYQPVVVDEVRVVPDFTTTLDFQLEQTVLGGIETIEIKAEKPLIQKDLTGTTRFVDREQIENLPTRGYQEAASLQAGITSNQINQDLYGDLDVESSNNPSLHVRGGRAEEVAYFVDGFSQQDPLTGLSTTSINQNAIDQIVVMTGGFNAEYGKIMSGAVNVITREGASKYFGAAEVATDALAGDWIGAKSYDYNTYDLSLGGPIVPGNPKMNFFVSGERRWQRDRDPRPIGDLGFPNQYLSLYKDDHLPSNELGGWTGQAKLSWDLNPAMKLRVGGLASKDDWQEYHHQYLFDASHMPRYEDTNWSVFGTMTHTLNPKTFYTVGVNHFYTERFRGDGVAFKDLGAYGRPLGNPRYDPSMPLFFYGPTIREDGSVNDSTAHVYDDYLHRESSYYGFKGDLSSEWTQNNTAKFGVEYRYHTLRRYRHLFPVQVVTDENGDVVNEGTSVVDVDRFGYDLTDPEKHLDDGLDGAKHPKDASVYLQNKYELDQFVLNAGLRYDYLDVDTEVLANETLPLGEDRAVLDPQDLKTGEAHNKLSPRLGVAFPVSDRTQFHANYGIFYQQPNLEDLYAGYNYLAYKARVGGYYYAFGNPNLIPETTTAYEVGFSQQMADNARFDVTLFYKNVQDLVQVQSIRSSPNSYSSYRNTDYGTIKGLDFTFDLRRTNNITATVNYTFSFANGTGSAVSYTHLRAH